MDPTLDVKTLLADFATFLIIEKHVAPSTAQLYRSAVSTPLKREKIDLSDEDALNEYATGLMLRAPAQFNVFLVSWKHFVEYMSLYHSTEIASVRMDDFNRGATRIPTDLLFDLHLETPNMPLTSLRLVRWGDISRHADGRLIVTYTSGRSSRSATYILRREAESVLIRLRAWGYRTTEPTPTSYVLPEVPDTHTVPVSMNTLHYAIKKEKTARLATAAKVVDTPRSVLAVAPPRALDVAATPVEEAPSAPRPRTPEDNARAVIEQQYWHKDVTATPDTPAGITDDVKRTLYAEWFARAPAHEDLDPMYWDATAMTEFADGESRARWRRVRWECGLSNDFGLPPQSFSPLADPKTVALERMKTPLVIPPPAIPDPALLAAAAVAESSTVNTDGDGGGATSGAAGTNTAGVFTFEAGATPEG